MKTVDGVIPMNEIAAWADGQIKRLLRAENNRGIGYLIWQVVNRDEYLKGLERRKERVQALIRLRDASRVIEGAALRQPVSPQGH